MCTKRPMELADTAKMMLSEDYKERFRAEYGQVAIRYQKLKAMLKSGIRENLTLLLLAREAPTICRSKLWLITWLFLKRERLWKK